MTTEYILTQPKSWVSLTPAMKMVFAIGLNEIDRLQVINDIEAKLRELNEIKESVMTAQTEIINRAKLELVAWPDPMEHPPIYSDKDPEEQVRATRYRTGWNDCLAKCKSATNSSINPQP